MRIYRKLLRRLLYLVIMLPVFFILFSFTEGTGVLEELLKKFNQYHADRPQEKLYLHLDKPFYAAGENIWFKAYLVEASLHRLDSQSRVVYVELLDNNKTIFKRQMLYALLG